MNTKSWKIRESNRELLNDQLYDYFDTVFKSHVITEDFLTLRLIFREVSDNIIRHDSAAFNVTVSLSYSGSEFYIKIKHDGKYFDPFDVSNNCTLLKQNRSNDFELKSQTTLNDSFNTTYHLKLKI